MKRIFIIFAVLCIIVAPLAAHGAEMVNAEQYINIVRARNHSILSAARSVEASYYQVLASVSSQRIKTGIGAAAAYYTATGSGASRVYNPLSYAITPSITQMIDISGVFRLDERISIMNYESARAGFDNTMNTILASAEQAFWNTVLARENLSLQRDVLRQRQENLRVTEEKFNQQLVPKLDVLRATTQVSDAQNKIVDAEGKISNTLATLRSFAGGLDVQPEEKTFNVPALDISSAPDATVALEHHPNVRQRRIQLAQSEVAKSKAEKGLSPTLSASAGWEMFYGSSTVSSFETGEANVRLSFNLPITDGNYTKYDTINKSIAIEAARQTVFASEAEVILNLSLALNNWNTARSLEENMKQQVVRSNEELKITELMYNEGMGSQLDLITAQTDNQTVRTNYLQAVLGMYTAIADLRKALGDYATNEDGSWKSAVARYGKEAPKSGESFAGKKAGVEVPQNNLSNKIMINVRGVNLNIDQSMDWLVTGNLPNELKKDEPEGLQLYKKSADGTTNEIYVPYKKKDVTREEAIEWLRKK